MQRGESTLSPSKLQGIQLCLCVVCRSLLFTPLTPRFVSYLPRPSYPLPNYPSLPPTLFSSHPTLFAHRLQVNMVHLNVPNVSSTSQKWTTTTSEANKLLEAENAAKLVGVLGMGLCCTAVWCTVMYCIVLYSSVLYCTVVYCSVV